MPTAADLSLNEMLHVLDVARTLRRDREIVETELNREELVAALRTRLLASAQATGDTVTPEEVEAAIEIYLSNLYTYQEPPLSGTKVLAYAWIWRGRLAIALGSIIGLWLMITFIARDRVPPAKPVVGSTASTSTAPPPTQALPVNPQTATRAEFQRRWQLTHDLAVDPAAIARLEELRADAEAAEDSKQLAQVMQRLADLDLNLRSEYEFTIVRGPDEQSGIDRYFTGDDGVRRLSGYYLILEAHTSSGDLMTRHYADRETGTMQMATRWGEQVSEAVFNRVRDDKLADGVVDDYRFAVKERGWLEPRVVFTGDDGQPLVRQGQITDWSDPAEPGPM
jgi:hypothetical protein